MSAFMGKRSLAANASFEEMLALAVRGRRDAKVSVGIVRGGENFCALYGADGFLPRAPSYTYEIASITKTFTASLLSKAVSENRASLDDTVDKFLDLPKGGKYPTLRRLITHTSGYKNFYCEWPLVKNLLLRRPNAFAGITEAHMLRRASKAILEQKAYAPRYSGFGVSLVGMALSKIYGMPFANLLKKYLREELGLFETRISDGSGDLSGYWRWSPTDAFLPAGGLASTMGDMCKYIRMHMECDPAYLASTHEIHSEIGSVGLGWMLDERRGLVYHGGATSRFTSFAAFTPKMGVVALANLPPRGPVSIERIALRALSESKARSCIEKGGPYV